MFERLRRKPAAAPDRHVRKYQTEGNLRPVHEPHCRFSFEWRKEGRKCDGSQTDRTA
jgi:hypothetical protein